MSVYRVFCDEKCISLMRASNEEYVRVEAYVLARSMMDHRHDDGVLNRNAM